MSQPWQHDVFIAYAGPDQPRARELHDALTEEDVSVFFDRVTRGDRWVPVLSAAMKSARILAVLVTRHLDDEASRAICHAHNSDSSAIIAPIRLDDTAPPCGLDA